LNDSLKWVDEIESLITEKGKTEHYDDFSTNSFYISKIQGIDTIIQAYDREIKIIENNIDQLEKTIGDYIIKINNLNTELDGLNVDTRAVQTPRASQKGRKRKKTLDEYNLSPRPPSGGKKQTRRLRRKPK
jgi:hypothetical protein